MPAGTMSPIHTRMVGSTLGSAGRSLMLLSVSQDRGKVPVPLRTKRYREHRSHRGHRTYRRPGSQLQEEPKLCHKGGKNPSILPQLPESPEVHVTVLHHKWAGS